ncbi:hypothetical protein AQUCO_00900790v1 [Aquilegia coerulea]|uniref:Carbohydrate kinase PfkB domain-containing protein n=1 Tax=Aquilegia coerulea TaxID=218851 RepID=A0A2G5EFF4_AQUCA|nr:hypothetical protein AQUCO_00900790v1 [Aquilegia coerulea]PIA54479.1 hypothetical protein AQUCO_00900790v1 [Aquilegia coerulea]
MATLQFQSSFLNVSHLQSFHFLSTSFTTNSLTSFSNFNFHKTKTLLKPQNCQKPNSIRAITSDDNGALETPKPARRGRKKGTTTTTTTSSTSTKKPRRSKKKEVENAKKFEEGKEEEESIKLVEEENDDDEMDFPYEDPPLICCFGAAQKEFVPTVRISSMQRHPDIYSTWKELQWDPPEFGRAPGGPPSNVAIAHVRLGGRAAFMGKVGDDGFGKALVHTMNLERVQTRAVKFDSKRKTGVSFMKFRFEDGKMKAEVVRDPAENSLLGSELNIAVLKEARIFHFNSEVLSSASMQSTLYKAITMSKKYGGIVFFDVNLSLPLWRSRDETKKLIEKAWNKADIIEVSKQELEFLLDEDHYEWRRNYKPQYYAESFEQTKNRRDYYHYSREEISPLWRDGLKFLFVTDGTLRIHYYAPSFDGVVVGTEDVLITPYTCDRTGSGDAVVAAIMRKLTTQPEMFENQDVVERQLRFAIAAGIISQWTIGAVRGFPTESATQNLKEQVYVPSMW